MKLPVANSKLYQVVGRLLNHELEGTGKETSASYQLPGCTEENNVPHLWWSLSLSKFDTGTTSIRQSSNSRSGRFNRKDIGFEAEYFGDDE
jgi:hypothetical protein